MLRCCWFGIITFIVVLFAASRPVQATPTGLNNIPTAEVVPYQVLVLQAFSNFGHDRDTGWFTGAKYGPAKNWEIGIDDAALGAGSSTGPVVQAKRRFPLRSDLTLALGAANISNDSDRNGEVVPYAVVSAPLGRTRGHLGYRAEKYNQGWFFGADAAVTRRLTLRADWLQAADREESVSSLGLIGEVNSRWLGEAWATFPTAPGEDTSYVFKLDYVWPLAAHTGAAP